ncbi:hypothetical protein B1808_02675 [Pseudofulvimonas gallinarii]|jgi:RNA polymerase sigma factor (TIGR02999 family)|nr:hypothetical protein B1808_02675 [Pseudofulvimonas gallinarii]
MPFDRSVRARKLLPGSRGQWEGDMEPGEFTVLMARSREGDGTAHETLFRMIYAELRRIARRQLAGMPRGETLDTTSLVHESYLRLIGPAASHVGTRSHFLNLAARAMRQILCDYARRRLRTRERFDGRSLDDIHGAEIAEADRWVRLDEALEELERVNARQARIVECRFFGGLGEEETAEALAVSVRTVQRDWNSARQWLGEHMRED